MRFLIPILVGGAIGFAAGVVWPICIYFSHAANSEFDGGIGTAIVFSFFLTVPLCTLIGLLVGLLLALYEKFK
jgi:hypothetical protein